MTSLEGVGFPGNERGVGWGEKLMLESCRNT